MEIQDGSLSDDQFEQLRAMWAACGATADAADDASDAPGAVDATVRRALSSSPAAAAPGSGSGDVEGWPSSGSFRSLADHLASDVTAAAITHARGRLLMLHAAALADPGTGKTLLFVGHSGAGKTTICRTLGPWLRYLSDETAGITVDGRIEPYPKPLSVRVTDDHRPKRQVPPAEIGLLPVDGVEARAHRVVVLERSADAPARAAMHPLAVTEAIAAVTAEVSYLNALEAPLQRLAAACARGGGPVRVRYREAADLEALLPELLADGSAAPWSPVDVDVFDSDVSTAADASLTQRVPAVRRTAAVDAVADASGLVVLRAGVAHSLAGIGPFLWTRSARAITVAELTEAAVAEFGSPGGDAEPLVRGAVDELVDAGLLEWVGP